MATNYIERGIWVRAFGVVALLLAVVVTAGCGDAEEDARLQALAEAEKTLTITPQEFIEEFNLGVYEVYEEMAIASESEEDTEAIAKQYVISLHNESMGLGEGMFEAISGPTKLTLFGKVNKSKNELVNVGVVLTSREPEFKRDYLAIAMTLGVVFTNKTVQEMEKTVNRLTNSVLNNPEQIAVEGVGDVMLSVFISNAGVVFQAARKP